VNIVFVKFWFPKIMLLRENGVLKIMLEANGEEEQEDGKNCTLRRFMIWNLHQDQGG